jgi:hypothetical protein
MANAARIEGGGSVRKTTPKKDSDEGASATLRVSYTSRPDAIPENELAALANVYRYLLDHHDRRRDAGVGGV